MNKLPKEILVDILDYLDNADWYNCLKASKLFHVDNEPTIKQRQRLCYSIDIILRMNNIDDIQKLLKRRLHSNQEKRQLLNLYLEQILPIQSIRDKFLFGIASYITGNFDQRDYVLYGNGKNGKEEFLFFIERVFFSLYLDTSDSDDDLLFDISDSDIAIESYSSADENANNINDFDTDEIFENDELEPEYNDDNSKDEDLDDNNISRRLFVERNRNNVPDIEYHQCVKKLEGCSISCFNLNFCLSKNKRYLAFSTRTEPDFETAKYNSNGDIVFTNVDHLVNSYNPKVQKNIVMIPFISKFVDQPNPQHRFEFQRMKDIKQMWDKLVIEFIVLLCELYVKSC